MFAGQHATRRAKCARLASCRSRSVSHARFAALSRAGQSAAAGGRPARARHAAPPLPAAGAAWRSARVAPSRRAAARAGRSCASLRRCAPSRSRSRAPLARRAVARRYGPILPGLAAGTRKAITCVAGPRWRAGPQRGRAALTRRALVRITVQNEENDGAVSLVSHSGGCSSHAPDWDVRGRKTKGCFPPANEGCCWQSSPRRTVQKRDSVTGCDRALSQATVTPRSRWSRLTHARFFAMLRSSQKMVTR